MERKNKLTLLGIWNVMPLLAWPWFSDKSVNHFKRLAGFNIKSFTFVKNQLHHQYLLHKSTVALFDYFDSLTEQGQKKYIQGLYNDYYKHTPIVKNFIKKIEKRGSKLSNEEIIKIIEEWTESFSKLTMVIWFILLLDIWYPDPEQKKEIKKISAKVRNEDGYLHERVQKGMKRVFKEIANHFEIRPEDIYFLFPEEIVSILRRRNLKKLIIKKRKDLCVTTNIFGKYRIYEGKKAKELLKKFVFIGKVKKENLLKGLSACLGKVRGRVRKVLADSEFSKFKEGEILVTLQTMVYYVPIMKKSKAVLTEFGGMTSHAAIVSRELKKPCIVGISGLTASLKDGDLVEVDANKGIVKIFKERKRV